eukprot:TRINITY_DN27867_c0_g1_i1.p1 TRINITY_DN27867_c0_g1~~TRINITY_DN27867_c0_g1_i1.p1  ORF type:complete len:995 (-),score=91.18 TRINITY_DN27867_c0_g1_i1:295-3279(-)
MIAIGGLPWVDHVLLLVYDPWWLESRQAASEIDRLAEGLILSGEWEKKLRVMTVDCSVSSRRVCELLLEKTPRAVLPLWMEGVDAPKIGRLSYGTIADAWPRTMLPTLVLGTRESLLNLEDEDDKILRRSPAPASAEDMLAWVATSVPLGKVHLTPRSDFWRKEKRYRYAGPEWHATDEGCECMSTWRHCEQSSWERASLHPKRCSMHHGCSMTLGFCKTKSPCGASGLDRGSCSRPQPFLKDQRSSLSSQAQTSQGVDARDIEAALALWLHNIFERQAFETIDVDPKQLRRKALVDFLQVLCSYWPQARGGQSSHGCRKSLCRVGGLLENKYSWEEFTEVIEVAYEQGKLNKVRINPLLEHRGRVRRIRWQALERHWRLCERPWTHFARNGFATCAADDPAGRGLPCGVWMLLHAVASQVDHAANASAHAMGPCGIGPHRNRTMEEMAAWDKARATENEEAAIDLLRRKRHNSALSPDMLWIRANVDAFVGSKPPKDLSRYCFRSDGKYKPMTLYHAQNSTLKLVVHNFFHEKGILRAYKPAMAGEQREFFELQLQDSDRRQGDPDEVGAFVQRVFHGSLNVSNESVWHVAAVGGSRVNASIGHTWREMLRRSVPESTEVVLEGPLLCGHEGCGDCSEFAFVPDDYQEIGWEPVGVLKELRTGQCIVHLYQRSWLIFNSDLGWGLTDCYSAERFRLNVHRLVANNTFCKQYEPNVCMNVVRRTRLPHGKMVLIDVHREVPAVPLGAHEIVARIRRMIDIFWPCYACRENFLIADYNAVPVVHSSRDLVMWMWRVHNGISTVVQNYGKRVSALALTANAVVWPPASLCPTCWNTSSGTTGDEDAVYKFLVSDFYAPGGCAVDTLKQSSEGVRTGQRSAEAASGSDQLDDTRVDATSGESLTSPISNWSSWEPEMAWARLPSSSRSVHKADVTRHGLIVAMPWLAAGALAMATGAVSLIGGCRVRCGRQTPTSETAQAAYRPVPLGEEQCELRLL